MKSTKSEKKARGAAKRYFFDNLSYSSFSIEYMTMSTCLPFRTSYWRSVPSWVKPHRSITLREAEFFIVVCA